MRLLFTRITLLILGMVVLASCGDADATTSGVDAPTMTPGPAVVVEPTSTAALQPTETAEPPVPIAVEPTATSELPAVVAADPTATSTPEPQAGQATMIFFTAPG